jgi:hypothetical protein
MSYEKEAVAPATTPTQSNAIMREDRLVDPHRLVPKTTVPQTTSGQSTISETKEVTLSPKVSELARKEQKYRQQEQDLKTREAALTEKAAKIARFEAMETQLKAKDYSGLEGVVDYNEYTNYLIEKQRGLDPNQEAVKKLTQEVEDVKKAQIADIEKRYEAAVSERRKAVVALVSTDTNYASIKELKAEEAVVQHILDTWEHDNIDLSPEQAAKEVEEVLIEKAKKWSSLSKLAAVAATEEPAGKKPLPAAKTITNNMTVSGEVTRPNKSFAGMSDGERYAEARRRAEAKLKQGK